MSDRAEVPTKPADDLEVGDDAASEVGDWLTEAVAAATEGEGRAGTAKWPECCRDTYSLAIEEIAAALAPLIEARVREARADAWDEAVGEMHDLGWLHDWACSDAVARNPYRAHEASEVTSETSDGYHTTRTPRETS